MLIDDPAVHQLYSREKRKIVSSFHSDIPEYVPDAETLNWHRQRGESHAVREVLVVLSGSTVQQINGKFYQCDAQTVVLFDRNETHTLGYDCNSNGLHCWISILPEDLRWVFMRGTEKYTLSSRIGGFIKLQTVTNTLKRLWNDIRKVRSSDGHKKALIAEIDGCLSQLFAEIYMQAELTGRKIKIHSRKEYNAQNIQYAKDYLYDHCGCSLKEISELTGLSPTHFSRLFKQFVGAGFKEYINTIRQEKYLKMYGTVLAKQLAEELGFSSSSALAHWHKQNFNAPYSKPSEEKNTAAGK